MISSHLVPCHKPLQTVVSKTTSLYFAHGAALRGGCVGTARLCSVSVSQYGRLTWGRKIHFRDGPFTWLASGLWPWANTIY